MKTFFLTVGLFASSVAFAANPLLSMVASNAVDQDLPMQIFEGKSFHALAEAQFVKLHMYPDQPIKGVQHVEIEACDRWAPSDKGYRHESAFLNFDEIMSASRTDETEPYLKFELDNPKVLKITSIPFDQDEGKPFADIESLTINFGPYKNICVKSVKFFDAKGKQIQMEVPHIVGGSVTASNVQVPAEAYAPENMFDSKFENAWATNKVRTGVSLDFNFEKETKVEKIKIWNGYQRSVTHCQQNSRVKTLEFKGDGGYSATVTVADKLGSQEIALPKPFTGKKMTVTIKDSVKGKTYEDLAITELRFFDGKNWFLLNPLAHIQDVNRKIRSQFEQAKLAEMLNAEFSSNIEGNDWKFRLRSDGSLFIQGYTRDRDNGLSYSALGNFEIKSVKPDTIELRIFGFLYKSKYSMDCNGCGVACNSPGKQDESSQKIFQQMITLKPVLNKTGKVENVAVTNETKSAKLKFTRLAMKKSEIPK